MKLHYEYHHGVGQSIDDCYVIGYRWDPRWDFDAESGESVVLQRHGGQTHLLLRQQGALTGLWRSPGGGIHVSYQLGGLYRNPETLPRRDAWKLEYVDGTLHGIWGLDEQNVFAWGTKGGRPFMVRRSPSGWREISAPGPTLAMHGVAPDVIIATGRGGLIGRWDGMAWSTLASPTVEPLSSVFVVSPDEMYACSPNGVLLEGSIYGWARVLDRAPMLNCVAKWGGGVWVGSTVEGLFRFEDNQLSPFDPEVRARAFHDAGPTLLVTTPDRLLEMRDGRWVGELGLAELAEATDALQPTWLTGREPHPPDEP